LTENVHACCCVFETAGIQIPPFQFVDYQSIDYITAVAGSGRIAAIISGLHLLHASAFRCLTPTRAFIDIDTQRIRRAGWHHTKEQQS